MAQQVSQDAITFVRHMKGVRIAAIMGGMPFGKQIQQLKGAQVVVATPGRLLDLVNRRQIKLDQVRSLIVDEADRMLDLGFSEDLEAISDLANNRKQTLMFSATFAGRIITLAERMMNDPQRIAIETGHSTNTDITQTLHWFHNYRLLAHAERFDDVVLYFDIFRRLCWFHNRFNKNSEDFHFVEKQLLGIKTNFTSQCNTYVTI